MVEAFTCGRAATLFAEQLRASSGQLSRQWLAQANTLLVSTTGHTASEEIAAPMAALIEAIASSLESGAAEDVSRDVAALNTAAAIGADRFEQRATVHQLLREYQILADLLESCLLELVRTAAPPLSADEVVQATRRVTQSIRLLQQQTIDTFFTRYAAAVEHQHLQLLGFGRLVGHEMRQPLGVLQVVSGVLPVREGDYEFVHLLDIFDRNVRRLADVAARLERLSHATVEDAFVPLHHRVNLSRVVQGVADTLSDMARAREVRIEITGPLPVLDADAARIEMIFLNLMANAIKYSDPGKPERRVQVMEVPDAARPTVIVRDNGIGIPARHVQHIFREFVRAHAQRDRELGTSGLGIGLSIVRDSMDASGGEVRLESIEGVGTTVTLSWPVGRRRG